MNLPFFKTETKIKLANNDPETITIPGTTASLEKLEKELKEMNFFSNIEKNDKIEAIIIESFDRKKNPYKYIKFTFTGTYSEVFFTNPPEVPNPTIRKLEVIKSFFSLLNLLEIKGLISPNRKELYENAMDTFEIRESFASSDIQRMKFEFDKYVAENLKNKEDLTKLKKEKETLTQELLGLEKKCQLLESKISKLESLTDTEIDQNILKWVEEHEGNLNEKKFCLTFNVPAQRLEERLDSLSKRGVIRIV